MRPQIGFGSILGFRSGAKNGSKDLPEAPGVFWGFQKRVISLNFLESRPNQPPGGPREVPRDPQGPPKTPFWDDISLIFTYNFEMKSYSDIYFSDSNM